MSSSRLMSRSVFASAGFTLVELLVAVAVSSVALTAAYLVFASQQRAFYSQDQMAALQQNLRFSMNRLERDTRMVGCNPTGTATTGILTANGSVLRFAQDTRGAAEGSDPDGAVSAQDEDVTYGLADSDGDGDSDLLRNGALMAENIDALNFVYLDSNNNVLDDDGDGNLIGSIPLVRSIQITLIARTARPERDHVDNTVYLNGQGDTLLPAQNDSYRRRLVSTTVRCRNL